MIATEKMPALEQNDAQLVADSLAGERDAFRGIIERYQNLICSLTYSATGSLPLSEDLAQETFVTAWRQLAQLRERSKLRSWLCGIARFVIGKELRRQGRQPVHGADPLEAAHATAAPEPLPSDQLISNEEQAILWRSLERIPETYREALVLFYREHQSVEAVAASLELTEDAVKQRLARGRRLLQEQVLVFLEGALERSNPGKAFTVAVLASLPALTLSAKAAAIGATTATGGATAKAAGGMGLLSALAGPLIVFVPNYFAYRVTLAGAHSEVERAAIKFFWKKVAAITLALFIPVVAIVLWLSRNQTDQSHMSGLLATCLVLIFLPTMIVVTIVSSRKSRQYYTRLLTEEYGGVFPKPAWEFCSQVKWLGLPLVHIRIGDQFADLNRPVKAWIAVGNTAIGGFFAFGAAAIAPIAMGGFSFGLLSLGGLATGVVALGGIAAGVWPVFGGFMIGWQAFNGCFAIGWNAAAGLFAWAHDYAVGRFASAAQVNNEVARQFIFNNPLFRCAELISRHWYWLNLFWMGPFFIMWRIASQRSARH